MNLVALLARRAARTPNVPALIDRYRGGDRSLTFRELQIRVEQCAGKLARLGLKRGDVILLFQPVSIELYIILLAAFHSGLRVMLADPSAGASFLSQCCKRVPPQAFFGPWKAQLLRWLVPGLRKIPLTICSNGWFPGSCEWKQAAEAFPVVDVPDEEPALVTFTSGSTGQPKAAVRTHGFLVAQHEALASALEFRMGQIDLVTLPVFVLANLASGLTSVLADTDLKHPGKADAHAIRSQCQRNRIERCAASPAFFEALLSSTESMPRLEKIYTGGAPVFPDLLQRLTTALPRCQVTAVYGSTEAEPMSHLHAGDYTAERLDLTARGGGLCAGQPVPEIELRVIQDRWGEPLPELVEQDFDALQLRPGQAGEVVVTGGHVLPGYLDGHGDAETKIHSGGRIWHRTGDAGWREEDGTLWLLGRSSAKLPSVSHSQPGIPERALDYPFAIECALRTLFPGHRTAAIGWKDQRTLVVGSHPSPEALVDIERAARALGMTRVIGLPEIPLDRRHRAKIDYPALFKLLGKL